MANYIAAMDETIATRATIDWSGGMDWNRQGMVCLNALVEQNGSLE